MITSRLAVVVGASAVLAIGVAACGGDDDGGSSTTSANLSGKVAGAGSSAQEAAQEAWIANFQNDNPNVTISYDPVGSGGGQEQFIAGGTGYGGSDAPFEGGQISDAMKRCKPGDLIEIPVYVSPIAVIYNLEGVDKLQLTPDTLAQIFAQKITTWDDPAIAKENPDADLPSTRITPVNRSDDSGTTFNFTDYLSQAAPKSWPYDASETWPVKGGEAGNGTSGVVEAVNAGDGTIGYADASQAGKLGIASIQVGDKYIQPTAEGAANDLEASSVDDKLSPGQYMTAYSIERTSTDPSNYPLLLASYIMACTQYDSNDEAAIVKGFLNYIISPDGQDAAKKNAGSAPITDATREKNQPAVDAIQTG